MKILCFGDSNTYGYDPRSRFGGQYPAADRWVDRLGRTLGCRMINAGENGREIPRRQWELDRFQLMMTNQHPVDLLIILLGANDLLQGNGAEAVCGRMETFLKHITLERSRILLIGPPIFQPGTWVDNQSLIEQSAGLSECYQKLAESLQIGFVNAADWEVPMTFDGVHFTEEGHRAFADGLAAFFAAKGATL